MKNHWIYLKHVLSHKWMIAKVGFQMGLSWWKILVHDIDKFYPDEWFAHVKAYADRGNQKYAYTDEFFLAAIKHRQRSSHHWQHYILISDSGAIEPVLMPDSVINEMLVDWTSVSKANHGNVGEWYKINQKNLILHPVTRKKLEGLLIRYGYL